MKLRLSLRNCGLFILVILGLLIASDRNWAQSSQPEAPRQDDAPQTFEWQFVASTRHSAAEQSLNHVGYAYSDGYLIGAGGRESGPIGSLSPQVQLWTVTIDGAGAGFLQPLASVALAEPRVKAAVTGDKTGFFIIAGENANGPTKRVEMLAWDAEYQVPLIGSLPDLPHPVNDPGAAVWSGELVVSGASDEIYALNLASIDRGPLGFPRIAAGQVMLHPGDVGWSSLPSLPPTKAGLPGCGPLRLSAQHDGDASRLYAFALCRDAAGVALVPWVLRPPAIDGTPAWNRLTEIRLEADVVAPAIRTVAAQGQANILVAVARGGACADDCAGRKDDLLIYNSVLDRWRHQTRPLPDSSMVSLAQGQESLFGVFDDGRGAKLWSVPLHGEARRFGVIDMSVIITYLAGIVIIGAYYHRKSRSSDDFFRGGQSIPWWAAACSIHAALFSSLSYLALPALVYRTNWILYGGMMMIWPITPIISRIVMPFFRRIDATSAYEYLSMRFSMPIRILASAIFMIFQISRIGIILSLTGLALAMITPLAPWQSVVLIGLLSVIYSALGGVEAVIWTEVLQTLVLSVGAIICLVFLIGGIDGHLAGFIGAGLSSGKFKLIDWSFGAGSGMRMSIWVVVLGSFGQNLATYSSDQSIIQRYMVTADEKKAASSIWLNALVSVPSIAIFFLIGSALFFFYQAHPDRLDPAIQTDQIFPFFIATEVPVGIAGLIIAGVFAATQSAVASSMNSVASTLVADFMRPLRKKEGDRLELAAGRLFTALVGLAGTAIGILFISPAIRSLMEQYIMIIGLCMGALCALFLVGMTSRRIGSAGITVGLAAAVAVMTALWRFDLINGLMFASIGIVTCYAVALLASIFLPPPRQSLANLTIFTLTNSSKRP